MSGEYNVRVTVRNNLILQAMADQGYASQSELARAAAVLGAT